MAILNSILAWYMKQRIGQIEEIRTRSEEIQQNQLTALLEKARETEWGRKYDYRSIRTPAEYARRVPVQDYETQKSWIQRMMDGEQNLLWPSEITWFAKSSGTTSDKSKFIPVSFEALEDCHFRAGKDILSIYCDRNPNTKIFDGKSLIIGGSHKVNSLNTSSYYGDLSAVLMNHMPMWANWLRTPDLSIALMDDWEKKLEMMASATAQENVTNIGGVPTWTMVLMEKLLEKSGKQHIHEIWPNLELYIHGGVSFVPYREQFQRLCSIPQMNYLETYNASEGFFGIQDRSDSSDLLLMTDYGIYYEFVPADQLDREFPDAIPLWEVKPGVKYAMVISTNAGLWRYMLGDTVCFSSVNPYHFRISGRTKAYINAFGEELMVDNADRAIAEACRLTGCRVREYTAAPVYMDEHDHAGHEWLIEFEQHPDSIEAFGEILDNVLKQLNSDYEAKRHKDIALKAPRLVSMPAGSFHNWLKQKGKLGGQHKVPRLYNDRRYVDELRQVITPSRSSG